MNTQVEIWTGTIDELFIAMQPDEASREEAREWIRKWPITIKQKMIYRYTIQQLEELRLKREMEEIDCKIKRFDQQSKASADKDIATRRPYKFLKTRERNPLSKQTGLT